MEQQTFYVIASIGVGVVTLAFLVQAVCLVLVAKSARAIKEHTDELSPKVETFLKSADKTIQDSKKQFDDVTGKANSILDSTKEQVEKTDEFLTEAVERARNQLDRVELVLDDSIGRIHETVVLVNKGILVPLREINGLTTGIRTALRYLLRGGRPDVSRATSDEEMFI